MVSFACRREQRRRSPYWMLLFQDLIGALRRHRRAAGLINGVASQSLRSNPRPFQQSNGRVTEVRRTKADESDDYVRVRRRSAVNLSEEPSVHTSFVSW
jgi:hypothetical protein